MRILFSAIFILMLAACASNGPAISNAQIAELQKGKTTADDVLRRYGKPSFNSDNLDGTRTLAYLQEGTRSNAAAMVAMIGAVAAGAGSNANVNSIIFRFDGKGLLSSHERTSESQTTVARNEAGAAAVPNSAPSAGSVPAGTSPASATPSQQARPAPARQPARADGLPDWLPSGNYDPRNPF